MDTFYVEAVDLIEVEQIIIGHERRGAGQGWYLERIKVTQPKGTGQVFMFYCKKWLDTEKGDRLIERRLFVGPPEERPKSNRKVLAAPVKRRTPTPPPGMISRDINVTGYNQIREYIYVTCHTPNQGVYICYMLQSNQGVS